MKRRRPPTLPGRIEPTDSAVEEAALQKFVEGMAALATQLLLDGVLDPVVAQPTCTPATNDATMAA